MARSGTCSPQFGAGRTRLVRQVLTASVLLAGAGALAGLLFAWAGVKLLTSMSHFGLPNANVIEINLSVLGFNLILAFITGILFGIVPALLISRPDFYEELKGAAGTSTTVGRKRGSASDVLVVAEVGLSLLLLVAAGLLLKDFMRLRNNNIGVRAQGVWTAAISLPSAGYQDNKKQFNFSQTLLDKLKRIPGMESAALSTRLPLEGGSNGYVAIRGKPFQPMSGPLVEHHAVSPDYFKVMGIPLLQGRTFSDEDINDQFTVDERLAPIYKSGSTLPPEQSNAIITPVIVNQATAQKFWPGQNSIGQKFSFGRKDGPWLQVVGVVGDVKQHGITNPPYAEAYVPFDDSLFLFITLHTWSASRNVTAEVRQVLGQVDSTICERWTMSFRNRPVDSNFWPCWSVCSLGWHCCWPRLVSMAFCHI